MKAVHCSRYGAPEVMSIREVPTPEPKAAEIQVKIHASVVSATDCTFRLGRPFISRLFTGLRRPKYIPGDLFAGTVASVGANTARFKPGDRVFGFTDTTFGAHAEYRCLPESNLSSLPAGLEFGAAAALCDGGLTALPFLRDTGRLQPGQKVLIIGASGAVGTAAVQLAKVPGAVVTGVCSANNTELVTALGADQVIDYTQTDYTQLDRKFDLIFDTVNKSSYTRCRRILTARGIYMTTAPRLSTPFTMLWTKLFSRRTSTMAATGLRKPADKLKDLEILKQLIAEGRYRSVIDRSYTPEEIVEAHRYVGAGHKKGNVILRFVQE